MRQPSFRGLWFCAGVYFIGNGMQPMAAAWLMVELAGSSFLAALVQTDVFLPMFLLALPAGVLADTTDRRRLISGALLAQVAACALLAVVVLAGWGGPASVLFLVFVCGCCTAVLTPAWNSSVVAEVCAFLALGKRAHVALHCRALTRFLNQSTGGRLWLDRCTESA